MYVLDTNVISEPTKPTPDQQVLDWLRSVDEELTCLSVITIGEVRAGVERMAVSRARHRVELWLEGVVDRFGDRVLPIDRDVADTYGRLVARGREFGRPGNPPDVLIAATAMWHGFMVVTRNVKDFQDTGVDVFNPWELAGE